jgi:DNA-binding MarR family transcriptional regulator
LDGCGIFCIDYKFVIVDGVTMKKRTERKKQIDMETLISVIDETRSLFHRMTAVAESIHHKGRLSGGRRGVLMELDRHGPRTVPHMARERPVSRQLIQTIVNDLAKDRLVETKRNPAHKRSHLISLTEKGRAYVADMKRQEGAVLSKLPLEIPPENLRTAAEVLRSLTKAFIDPDWLENLKQSIPSSKILPVSKRKD